LLVQAASDFDAPETGAGFCAAARAGAVWFFAGAEAVSAGALGGAKGFFGETNLGRATCLFSRYETELHPFTTLLPANNNFPNFIITPSA